MSATFDPTEGLTIVHARIQGPHGSAFARLALDTGAMSTLVNCALLVAVGCGPEAPLDQVEVVTGSGVEFIPPVAVPNVDSLEQERTDFPVVAHTLPPSASVDGVLGLDFMRGQRLTVDFRAGTVALE